MVFTVGITGGISCGKTTAANYFADKGVNVIDADLISRDMVKLGTPALKSIHTHFGSRVMNKDGTLHRKALRHIIFNDASQKKWLEDLLHPLIRKQIVQSIQSATSDYCILVSPLLLETGQHLLVDRILVINTTEAQQVDRTILRDRTTTTQAQAVIDAQLSPQERQKQADDLVENHGSIASLHQQLSRLHQYYLQLAREQDHTVS